MKAVVLTGVGEPERMQVREVPDPAVGPGEVRVRVRAAGVNFADLMARSGVYPDAPDPPCVLGYEFAGEVESVGPGVEGRSQGERVFGACMFGGQAELVTVPAGQVYPIPDSFSGEGSDGEAFERAAAFPVNYATAQAALIHMGGLGPGQSVLIHAAAGGVGIAATQIAKRAGAEIFGTASLSKHEAIRAQGVDHPIDYRNLDFAEEVMRLTDGKGVDLVIDAIGPSSFRKDYRILRQGGRLVMFGFSAGQSHRGGIRPGVIRGLLEMPVASMPWWKSLTMMNENKGIVGLNLLHWWKREGLDRLVGPLLESLAAGELAPVVAASYPFERAAEAHRLIESRANVGKVVLTG